MKSRVGACCVMMLLAWPTEGQYKRAAAGYKYEFPHDHFNHEQFQTEWWYYTGNLSAADGHKFGFELTFFRQGVDRSVAKPGTWAVQDIYLAHLALSDIDGGRFYHAERTNRAGPGLAGISEAQKLIWNGNWSAGWQGNRQELRALDDRFSFSLQLDPEKHPVIHGENGISQKAAGTGHASHYLSLTRSRTTGTIEVARKSFNVLGLAWMDHEFFTEQLAPEQSGWDWMGVQLADRTELMLYRMRTKDGSVDVFSSGTFVDRQGRSTHLRSTDFSMTAGSQTWTSAETGVRYPIEWKIIVPQLGLELTAKTRLKSQELTSKSGVAPTYWEGAMEFYGTREGAAVDGVGYLEMTGYDRPVRFGEKRADKVSR